MRTKYQKAHYIYTAEVMFGVHALSVAMISDIAVSKRGVLVPMWHTYGPGAGCTYTHGDYMLVTDRDVEEHALAGLTYDFIIKAVRAANKETN